MFACVQQTQLNPSEQIQNKTKNTSRIRKQASFGKDLANLNSERKSSVQTFDYHKMPSKMMHKRFAEKTKSLSEKRAILSATDNNSKWGPITVSKLAMNTTNPIRKICDALSVPPNPNKEPIRLNLGDPTIAGNLLPSESTIKGLHDAINGHKFDGYGPAVGALQAREAVAKQFSTGHAPITVDDVVLASGCSHALQMAIEAIADPGHNILVPRPGFPLYSTLCHSIGIETRHYNLKMNDGGLVDLKHLESLIDSNTRAIMINNPSNPTGVVFPKSHLEDILKIAFTYKVPIIADEIYGDLVYNGAEFHSIATLSPKVPVLSCDGIGKRYLVPGWRLGWVVIHDRYNALQEVKKGIISLSQKIVGPCSLIQGALPAILRDTPASYFDNVKKVIGSNADVAYDVLARIPGLKPLKPQGAMYMMVGFDPELYGSETKFTQDLIREESVYCLPGSAFGQPDWFRLVLTYPEEVTVEACARITDFCNRRLRPRSGRHNHHLSFLLGDYNLFKPRSSIDDGSEDSLSNTESDD